MKTLLAHEWLENTGGSENVFEALVQLVPAAKLFCLWDDSHGRFGTNITESWLARTPIRRSKVLALPISYAAWRSPNLAGFDRVIVSSHAFAHHLASRAATVGLPAFAYVHSPARYLWAPELDPRGQSLWAKMGRSPLQALDRRTADAAVSYAANSQFVADRIQRSWGIDARVIHPPVDVESIQAVWTGQNAIDRAETEILGGLPSDFVLGAGRFVEYKRLDASISVGQAMGIPVVLAGAGPDETRLRHLARSSSVPVTFVEKPSTPIMWELFRRATILAFLSVEDFGIIPVESMAAGTPVLVNAVGGARESVDAVAGGAIVKDLADRRELQFAAEQALKADMSAVATAIHSFSKSAFGLNVAAWLNPLAGVMGSR